MIKLTGLKRLIGLTVVMDGRAAGHVAKGILSRDGKRLRGLVVRSGFQGARWLPGESIALIGQVSVIASGAPSRMPRDADFKLFAVSDSLGERLGVVTDALIDRETLSVKALEISSGPVDDLISGRWYATAYRVHARGGAGHVTIPTIREDVTDDGQNDGGGRDRIPDWHEV